MSTQRALLFATLVVGGCAYTAQFSLEGTADYNMRKGKYASAVNSYQQALSKVRDPDSQKAARLYGKLGEAKAKLAERTARNAAREETAKQRDLDERRRARGHVDKARAALQRGDLEKACRESAAASALSGCPDDARTIYSAAMNALRKLPPATVVYSVSEGRHVVNLRLVRYFRRIEGEADASFGAQSEETGEATVPAGLYRLHVVWDNRFNDTGGSRVVGDVFLHGGSQVGCKLAVGSADFTPPQAIAAVAAERKRRRAAELTAGYSEELRRRKTIQGRRLREMETVICGSGPCSITVWPKGSFGNAGFKPYLKTSAPGDTRSDRFSRYTRTCRGLGVSQTTAVQFTGLAAGNYTLWVGNVKVKIRPKASTLCLVTLKDATGPYPAKMSMGVSTFDSAEILKLEP